jgi:hypothetical protein
VLNLSQRDRDRLIVLHQVRSGALSVVEGAGRARLGLRHFRRLLRRFEGQGDGAVVHRGRGRRPNNALDPELRRRAIAKALEPLYCDFGPTLLAEHLARDPSIGVVQPATLRRWLIDEGIWQVKQRRSRHRRRRERRAAFGEMVLMDTSIHAWLEDRFAEPIVLIAMIDDATSRLYARFFPRDTGAANREMIVHWLNRHGRMGALYTDRASHFKTHFRASARELADEPPALTIIRRALDTLEIELILALTPQAKGRVERLFATLQDRLLKEMRIAGICTLEDANVFLEEVFIPFWEARFTVEAREAELDAHRPLPDVDLLRLFASTDQRVLREDYTFQFRNQHYQVEARDASVTAPGCRITLEHRLDGTMRYRCGDAYLTPAAVAQRPQRPAPIIEDAPPILAAPKSVRRPSPSHPWRRPALAAAMKKAASATLRLPSSSP